jgi:hypothetical protein
MQAASVPGRPLIVSTVSGRLLSLTGSTAPTVKIVQPALFREGFSRSA